MKTVELERDKLKKERDDKAAQLTQQQSRAETAELAKNKAIADKVTAERKLADEKRQGASVNNLILRLKTQSALENAIGVRQLQVDKNDAKLWEQINKAVVLGSFELERTQLKAKTGSGSDVLKIDARLNLGSVTPSSKFIGYYLSEPTTLARTTYLPKSIDQAKQKIIPIHRSPDSKDENEKGFFYIANDLPQEVNAVENWIFVMIDENEKPPVSYLLRLTKFQK